jgi:antibiotic biosynthesis monooxygenase (ABM) superfamily enzyme
METSMIERHITFTVPAANAAAFERFFDEAYRPAMAEAPGYVRVELLREIEEPARYQMSLRFSDPDSAAGWRTSPVHQALQPGLAALHDGSEVVGYDVIA